MNNIGRKLRIIRLQRRLSLRQVESLTVALAKRYGDASRKVSASWIGRLEREQHSIPHKTFETLKEIYGVSDEELTDEYISAAEASRALHAHLPELPASILKALTDPAVDHLLPPESWLAYFPETTLLPSPATSTSEESHPERKRRRPDRLYGVLGANDLTLLGVVHPGAVLEIDHTVRTIDTSRVYHSVIERPIYFLRSRDGFHCGWCQLDQQDEHLTLFPSSLTKLSQRSWRYRGDIEVVGLVTRVLTRLRFAKDVGHDHINRNQHSDSS